MAAIEFELTHYNLFICPGDDLQRVLTVLCSPDHADRVDRQLEEAPLEPIAERKRLELQEKLLVCVRG